MGKLLIVISSIALLCACTGVSKQDSRKLGSITSLNNHVSIKRQRQFVISPASSIGLMVKGSPNIHKHVLEGFKYHFRQVDIIDAGDDIANYYDFVFNVEFLTVELKSDAPKEEKKIVAIKELAVSGANSTDKAVVEVKPAKNASTDSTKKKKRVISSSTPRKVKPVKIKPLQLTMNISLIDALSGQVIDVAIVDAYSSVIRKPENDDFIRDTTNRYIDTLTSI